MMGFFSNLFAKQNCAVCGKECGTLHRSKLRDGQFLCDDCGNKCSKYIRLSELTLDEAKEHMEYMARMKRVFDEVFNKTEFRVNEYPSTPSQMGLVFCDELGMLYIDDRTGGRGKMPELIRYDQIASYEEYLDETPAKEPGQKPTLNGGGLKIRLVQPRGITEAETRRGMRPTPTSSRSWSSASASGTGGRSAMPTSHGSIWTTSSGSTIMRPACSATGCPRPRNGS